MTDEQIHILDSFCKYAGLENRADADMPNIICGLKPFFEGTNLPWWDPIDDYSIVTPEFLYYLLEKAKGFWNDTTDTKRR